MVFENLIDLVVRYWYVALPIYLALLFGVFYLIDYVFGANGYWVLRYTIGLPITFIVLVIQTLLKVITWPSRFRNRRLLKETFGIIVLDVDLQKENQQKVDSCLNARAKCLKRVCNTEEDARKGDCLESLKDATRSVVWAKKEYWQAHGLAQRNGFSVPQKFEQSIMADSYSSY